MHGVGRGRDGRRGDRADRSVVNIIGYTGTSRLRLLVFIAIGDLLLRLAVIAFGAISAWDPSLLTAQPGPLQLPRR